MQSRSLYHRHRDYTGQYTGTVRPATWEEKLDSLLRNREREAAYATPQRRAFLDRCIAQHRAIDPVAHDNSKRTAR